MQKQIEKQDQNVYQQKKKLLKKMGDIKKDLVINNNSTVTPEVNHYSLKIAALLSVLEQQLAKKEADLLKLEQDLQKLCDKQISSTIVPQTVIKQTPIQPAQVNNATQVAPVQTVQTNNSAKAEPIKKFKEHIRICPTCDYPSKECPVDQERLARGEVLACACTECRNKNYPEYTYY